MGTAGEEGTGYKADLVFWCIYLFSKGKGVPVFIHKGADSTYFYPY